MKNFAFERIILSPSSCVAATVAATTTTTTTITSNNLVIIEAAINFAATILSQKLKLGRVTVQNKTWGPNYISAIAQSSAGLLGAPLIHHC